MGDSTLIMPDGRTVGFATYGPDSGTPVVWCHGGPGSRLEPAGFAPLLDELGTLRLVEGHGHLSVTTFVVEPLMHLASTTE